MQLLLIDDHPLIHVAVRALVADFEPAVSLHGADGAGQAYAQLAALQPPPDLVLLDLQLGQGEDGFALLDALRADHPALPIVCMSESDQLAEVIRAIDQGAMGFIPKHVPPDEFRQALLLVVHGGIYVPATRPGNKPLPAPPTGRHDGGGRASLSQQEVLDGLAITPRQRQVLQCLLQAKPNKLIAAELKISAETVKDHVHAVYRVLGVNTRTQAVLAVAQLAR